MRDPRPSSLLTSGISLYLDRTVPLYVCLVSFECHPYSSPIYRATLPYWTTGPPLSRTSASPAPSPSIRGAGVGSALALFLAAAPRARRLVLLTGAQTEYGWALVHCSGFVMMDSLISACMCTLRDAQ
ncbi:hypothetical protein FB45DRAFT_1063007 [Roridomyces roridus]|uniref:Uncharacterized protein n=1 Tax=Roridomyces roridus TaxID=1738132 RepID=A0AAD7FHZ2_9AGAR|nr:hypothetical protein FB45DRAFT_1063007 [Roridomyces roridus]